MVADPYAVETPLPKVLGNRARILVLAAFLGEPSDIWLNKTELAAQAGMTRQTVADHIDSLVELNVVETRPTAGVQTYRLNRDSSVGKRLAQLEWELIDLLADHD